MKQEKNDCPAHKRLACSGFLITRRGSLWESEIVAMHSKTNFHFTFIKITEMINIWRSLIVFFLIYLSWYEIICAGKLGSNTEVIMRIVMGVDIKAPS